MCSVGVAKQPNKQKEGGGCIRIQAHKGGSGERTKTGTEVKEPFGIITVASSPSLTDPIQLRCLAGARSDQHKKA